MPPYYNKMEQILKAIKDSGLELNSTIIVQGDTIYVASWKEYLLYVISTAIDNTSFISVTLNLEYKDLEIEKLKNLLRWQYYQESGITVSIEPTGGLLLRVTLKCDTKKVGYLVKDKILDIIESAIEVIKIVKNPITNSQCLN